MIRGRVTDDGSPVIMALIAGREWSAIVDSGFNGDLELPDELRSHVDAEEFGPIESALAGGQVLTEEAFLVDFPFDGRTVRALATFVPGHEILVGTRLLRNHTLTIDFPAGTVLLERAAAG